CGYLCPWSTRNHCCYPPLCRCRIALRWPALPDLVCRDPDHFRDYSERNRFSLAYPGRTVSAERPGSGCRCLECSGDGCSQTNQETTCGSGDLLMMMLERVVVNLGKNRK